MKVDTTYQLKNDPNLLFVVDDVVNTTNTERLVTGTWVRRHGFKIIGEDDLFVTEEKFNNAFTEFS